MSRVELAELVGISLSHINKIEAGNRRPSIETFEKILDVLNADILARPEKDTVESQCLDKMHEIIINAPDDKAIFLTKTLAYMDEEFGKISE